MTEMEVISMLESFFIFDLDRLLVVQNVEVV